MANDVARETIFSRVESILRQLVGNEPISPETDLLTDLGIESLELVELGMKMEKEFETTLPIAALRGCVTVEDIVQLIKQSKTQAQGGNS